MATAKAIEFPPIPQGPDRRFILARVYPGYHEQAIELFQMDAEHLASHRYVPVAQSYAEGRYAQWLTTLAAVLIRIGLGLILLLFMAAVRQPGSLAVTYAGREVLV